MNTTKVNKQVIIEESETEKGLFFIFRDSGHEVPIKIQYNSVISKTVLHDFEKNHINSKFGNCKFSIEKNL